MSDRINVIAHSSGEDCPGCEHPDHALTALQKIKGILDENHWEQAHTISFISDVIEDASTAQEPPCDRKDAQ